MGGGKKAILFDGSDKDKTIVFGIVMLNRVKAIGAS